jgi:TRAP-type C4-dicarboxylate transport system permease large subunit
MMGVGFDPIWTGVIVTIMIEIGMLTPPVGMNLYVLVAITNGEVNLGQAARAAMPFWLLLLLGVAVLTMEPEIVLVLPNLVMGR